MPEGAKKQFTIGDLGAKISKLSAHQMLYILLLVGVLLVGYLMVRVQSLEKKMAETSTSQPQQTQSGQRQIPQGKVSVNKGHLPPLGSKNAKVEIVEFSDFQCPFCRRFSKETLLQLKKEYVNSGKVAIHYRHFPLGFHESAEPAAIASECANEQGKFWEYHDKIFEEQDKEGSGTINFTADDLKRWAWEIGLATNLFNSCLDSQNNKDKVSQDTSDGQKAGISGTPTFFINGTMLVGAQPFISFKTIIDEELAKQ